jgi:NADPH2:quinone reductase
MIGTVGSDEKAETREGERLHAHDRLHARELRRTREGAHRRQRRAGGLRQRRQGSVSASLDCLSPRGTWVCFGASSGSVPAFDIMLLAQKGSLYADRPTLATYAAKREDSVAMAGDLFELVRALARSSASRGSSSR